MTADCVFCGIVAGDLPASVVYDGRRVLAFMDLRPAVPGHLLVIPKTHAASLAELDPADGADVFATAQSIAGAVRTSPVRSEGVNLFLADGVAAGQEVFHVHLHVLPRFEGDGFGIRADFTTPSRAELDQTAETIRATLRP